MGRQQVATRHPAVDMGVDELEERMARDPSIMWRILYDIFDKTLIEEEKAEGKVRLGRRPKRPASREEILAVAVPPMFTHKPFPEALKDLIGQRSQRSFARRMGCAQGTVSKLLAGQLKPDRYTMERAAAAGRVNPWYFREWRAQYLLDVAADLLRRNPHMSVAYLRAMGVMGE